MSAYILAKYREEFVKVLIDPEDLELLSQRNWYVNKSRGNSVYTFNNRRTSDGKTVYMHRLLTGAKLGEYVDHINGDPCDNRRSNLRITTNQENCENRQGAYSNNTSGYRGVSFHRVKLMWEAYYWKNYIKYRIGWYNTPEEANKAVVAARQSNLLFSEMDKVA